MKNIFSFLCSLLVVSLGFSADAAVRDENATNRQTSQGQVSQRSTNTSNTVARTANNQNVVSRTSTTTTPSASSTRSNVLNRTTTVSTNRSTTNTKQIVNRAASPVTKTATQALVSRAATDTSVTTETRTGAEYERCKNAYFTCMDQFCMLKNDDYRRCSCSNRVYDLADAKKTLQDAGNQLTVFTENLDVVGMTAAQAEAMRTESEGESALMSDTSASKALLQAIMNSIRGKDSYVGGKYTDLNSINITFDTTNAFGTMDAGQAIAAYNGQNLYSAVYPQCRAAVAADCNDASLQRAITAYLMAIEQDCNTVQTAIETTQKELKSAVREGSAMLDLARVENRQKHNSSDFTTCLNEVEAAVLSEQVCGAGYKKCLDNGEFIDVSTGKPIAGVENFYKLEQLLTFTEGVDTANQKLSKITSNRTFVQNFENKVKKFAEPALDKCVEIADDVWAEYLDKAMLDIYYAQKAKVSEIKQGCFDFIASCYENTDTALTAAMKDLIGDPSIILQPDKITLSNRLCQDYIDSCNLMFDNNIIEEYVNNRQDTDVLSACRAVVKQCIDSFGGTNYENYYYPYSGIFKTGNALNWFTLYEYTLDETGNLVKSEEPVSECAKQLKEVSSCSSADILEEAFGGFDVIVATKANLNGTNVYYLDPKGDYNDSVVGKYKKYGVLNTTPTQVNGANKYVLEHHRTRPTGIATEVYNQIIDILNTQCDNVQGNFVELQFIKDVYKEDNLCVSNFTNSIEYGGGGKDNINPNLVDIYGIGDGENMCPRDYDINVDTQSWGACLCWENGGRRSKWGKSAKCVTSLPVNSDTANDNNCNVPALENATITTTTSTLSTSNWCNQTVRSYYDQVCPLNGKAEGEFCTYENAGKTIELKNLPRSKNYQ